MFNLLIKPLNCSSHKHIKCIRTFYHQRKGGLSEEEI